MAGDYLDSTGLGKVWAKVKGLFTRPHFYKQVTVQDDDFNVDVSQNGLYVKNLQFTDADGDQIGWLQNNHDGASYGISIGCSTPDDSANNQMLLGITPTGTPSAWFSQAGTVRNALGAAASSHTHGSISNTGAITSDTAAASGDKLIIADDSDSSKLKRSGIALGTDTTTFLRNDGTWAAPSATVTMEDTAVDAAVDAAFGITVTVYLTNPVNESAFNYCSVYETDSADGYGDSRALGLIDSPSGSGVFEMSGDYQYLQVEFGGLSVGSPYDTPVTGGVTFVGVPIAGVVIFEVSSDGTATIDGMDYDE